MNTALNFIAFLVAVIGAIMMFAIEFKEMRKK